MSGNASTVIDAGQWHASVESLRRVVVGQQHGSPVWLGDVASVRDEGGEPASYVRQHCGTGESRPAVTLSIAKQSGVNAIELTRAVQKR